MPDLAGPGEAVGQARRVELGQDQEVADVQHAGGRIEDRVEVGRGEVAIGAQGVDEPAILSANVDDQGLAGGEPRVDPQGPDVHAVGDQGLGGEAAQDVVADPAQIETPTPSLVRSTAVLAAPPPILRMSWSTATSSPGWGKRSMGGAT